jgi:hypothetical protein
MGVLRVSTEPIGLVLWFHYLTSQRPRLENHKPNPSADGEAALRSRPLRRLYNIGITSMMQFRNDPKGSRRYIPTQAPRPTQRVLHTADDEPEVSDQKRTCITSFGRCELCIWMAAISIPQIVQYLDLYMRLLLAETFSLETTIERSGSHVLTRNKCPPRLIRGPS